VEASSLPSSSWRGRKARFSPSFFWAWADARLAIHLKASTARYPWAPRSEREAHDTRLLALFSMTRHPSVSCEIKVPAARTQSAVSVGP
jgi:hypothetical protein